VRVGIRTFASLAFCAAAAAAALAHVAIDIVGDYALPHDTYDNVAHTSRDLLSGIALLAAGLLARHGLRICCEIAMKNRGCLPVTVRRKREFLAFVLGVATVSAILVPGMEWLDGRLDGVAVKELDDAFGGSILLGLSTTIVCATFVASLVFALARWLISHRDSIVTMIATLLHCLDGAIRPRSHDLSDHLSAPRRRRTPHAFRLCKRGPPSVAALLSNT
jgi:hypothetical protein